jgi:hypothetical protein
MIQFDPREGNAGGKDVRNITIRTTGMKEQSIKVGATLWPSHAHIPVAKGDLVWMEGKFSQTQGENNGAPVTYNNLSVSAIKNFGQADSGRREEDTASSAAADIPDDDIPF